MHSLPLHHLVMQRHAHRPAGCRWPSAATRIHAAQQTLQGSRSERDGGGCAAGPCGLHLRPHSRSSMSRGSGCGQAGQRDGSSKASPQQRGCCQGGPPVPTCRHRQRCAIASALEEAERQNAHGAGPTDRARRCRMPQQVLAQHTHQWMRRHGMPTPPPPLSDQQRAEIAECFQLLDADGSGGRCCWAPLLGAAAGRCCWALLLGAAAGRCCWALLLGAAEQHSEAAGRGQALA
jgi:hypothetical protein